MTPTIYRLWMMDTHGNAYEIYGGSDLKNVHRKFCNETFASGRLVIDGHDDTAARRPTTLALDREIIKCMILEEV